MSAEKINFDFLKMALESIINRTIEQDEYDEERKKIVLYHLDECLINLNNKKYFNLKEIDNLFKMFATTSVDDIKREVSVLNQVVDLTFEKCLYDFLKDKKDFNAFIEDEDIENFIISIKKQSDFYEEFINYILNDEKFYGELIEIEGFTAESLMNDYGLYEINAYDYMMLLREEPLVWKLKIREELIKKC